jgi:DNA (cytosine-5)-methyltransferase 1
MLELLTYEKKGSVEVANINKGGQKGSVADHNGTHIGCLSASDYKLPKLINDTPKVIHQLTGGKLDKMHEQSGRVYDVDAIAPTIHTMGGGNQEPKILQLNPSTESGGVQPYQQNRIYDSKGIVPSLCAGKSDLNIVEPKILQKGRGFNEGGEHEICPSITCNSWQENNHLVEPKIAAMRGRNPENVNDRSKGCPTIQKLEINENGTSNALTTVQKDNLVVENRIRKLTPTECFRLMGMYEFKQVVSDSQLYKQAGNSIVVDVLASILKKMLKKIFI